MQKLKPPPDMLGWDYSNEELHKVPFFNLGLTRLYPKKETKVYWAIIRPRDVSGNHISKR